VPPCSLILCPRGPKRSAQEGTVGKRREQRVMTLGVRSMFEHSHLAEECLAQAYERLVPLLSRRLAVTPATEEVSQPSPNRRAGGKQS
jgi:hypothetical protein